MILDEITDNKRINLPQLGRFNNQLVRQKPTLITELKLKSPTHPESFASNYQDVLDDYKQAGISTISVVTDQKYFGSDISMVAVARKQGFIVLRKDFIIHPSQLAEVYSEAVLLIARVVEPDMLRRLVDLSLELGVEPVVEIHSEAELDAVYSTKASVIAVNTRDLDKQEIDFDQGLALLRQIDDKYLKLLFSGIDSRAQIEQARQADANGVLVGTSVLSAPDRVAKIKELRHE